MTDYAALRRQLQSELLRLYSKVTERPWGLLFHNTDNPSYYEANGARQIRTETPEATIAEIIRFYHSRRLLPRAIIDEASQPPDLLAAFEAQGFEAGKSTFDILVWEHQTVPMPPPPSDLQIRVAQRRELEDLVAIAAEDDPWANPDWIRRRTRDLLRARGVRYYLAWRSNLPVAAAMLYQGEGMGLVESVVTRPHHRRQGIASALLRHIQSESRTPLLVEVDDETVASLYTRLGFEKKATATEWQCWLPAD